MKKPLQIVYDSLFAKNKVASQYDFADQLGYTEGTISAALKKDVISPKMQTALNRVFGIPKPDETPPERPVKRVPVIGDAAAGGDMEINTSDHYMDEYIDVGDLLRDSEAAFTVYGNSMTPAYPSGCILGIKRNADNFIQPGETYLLLTKSNRVFKRLYYNDDRTGYICVSDNHMKEDSGPRAGKFFYEPFEVKFEQVISVFDITGMIRRNRNSGIIPRQK